MLHAGRITSIVTWRRYTTSSVMFSTYVSILFCAIHGKIICHVVHTITELLYTDPQNIQESEGCAAFNDTIPKLN